MIDVIDGRTWKTPLTGVPLATVGRARLTRANYRGTYHFEGVRGFEFYRTKKLPVTGLQVRERFPHQRPRWQTWMVDDPLHWYGMAEAVAALPPGRIVVAGLGLGLMLHHMAADPRFTAIDVVERCADVVDLVRPTLPPDDRVALVVADFYGHLREKRAYADAHPAHAGNSYDGILWDLAVGKPPETIAPIVYAQAMCALLLPKVPLVQFGLRRKR